MEEIIHINEQYYILAASPRRDDRTLVLKHGETFAVFDHFGDMEQAGRGEEGLYFEGTRHLSRLREYINGRRPLLLSSTVRDDNCLMTVDLTNPDFTIADEVSLQRETIHIHRSSFLWEGTCYCQFKVRNYALHDVVANWSLQFDADFVDIFEVRGTTRQKRGTLLPAELKRDRVRLRYRGLDNVLRETTITFSDPPSELTAKEAKYSVRLASQQELVLEVAIACAHGEARELLSFASAYEKAALELQAARSKDAHVYTSNEQFNDWVNRSSADLHMMITQTSQGPYPYAGVPWFSTAFGRDGIITALEYLWINPQFAHGVLKFLAYTQAEQFDAVNDAQPGKILHETRRGEMAALREIPFGMYYGTADATPLFIVLANAYFERTADRALIEHLWPNIQRALRWIDEYADPDGDGFFEYARQAETGLVTQGWKDSFDSVFHAEGQLADAPIALCEVQGYVFAAWQSAAALARALGQQDLADSLLERAARLQSAFEAAFWCEDLGTYALALDRNKRPCRVVTSNAGHLLFAGIATPQRARRVAQSLMSPQMFSGWGIRTVATTESRYNPMAYHNGSIWPHDNALIALGLARYGLQNEVERILTGMFDASIGVDIHRMPELFCGFERRPGEGPTMYPVACAPQSWAAGTVFLLLKSCIGLQINAAERLVCFFRPTLPEFLQQVLISNLQVNDAVIDLRLERHASDVGVNILRRDGEIEVVVRK